MVSNPLKVLRKRLKIRMSGRVHRSPKLLTLLPLPPTKKKNPWNIHLFYFEYSNFMKNWRSLTTFVTHSTMWKREKRRTIIHWQTLSSSSDSPLGNNNQNSLTTPYEHQSFSRNGQSDDILQVIPTVSSDSFLNSNDNSKSTAPFDFITIITKVAKFLISSSTCTAMVDMLALALDTFPRRTTDSRNG